ncbi:MAG TPA: cupin domain-containing protein [Aggregatilineaceae bacterium]|nr:cupin domain-containing protein [Aggregatilineaceae bacterium]
MSTAKVTHYSNVPAQVYGETAPGTSIRWLIDEEHDGAPVYALRMIEIEPGGHTPLHAHPYEHENFVVEGEGRVCIEGTWHALKPGDVAIVPGNSEHTYENTGSTTFKFLCGIPVKKFQPSE